MIRHLSSFVLLAFTTFVAAAPAPPSNTVRAERTFTIQCQDDDLRTKALTYMQQAVMRRNLRGETSVVVVEVARVVGETVGVSQADALKLVRMTYEETTLQTMIEIDLHNAPAGTRMLAAEAADKAIAELQRMLDPHERPQFESAMRALDLANFRRQDSQERMEKAQQDLMNQTGAIDVSPSTIRSLLASLQTQREAVQIDLAAKQARRDALAEQIAKFSDEIRSKVKDDPIAAELVQVVQLKDEGLAQKKKMQQQGTISNSELNDAVSALAEAKAKLLERREQAALTAGGDILSGWNKELMTLTVDLAELKARAGSIDERLARFSHTAESLRILEEYQTTLAEQRRQLNDLEQRAAEARSNYERHRVEMNVVSSKNDPAPATQPAP